MLRTLLYEARAGAADARDEMVVAEGLGDERRQAAWPTKGHCRAGTPAGGDHSSRLERRHAVPLDVTRYHGGGRLIAGPHYCSLPPCAWPVKGKSLGDGLSATPEPATARGRQSGTRVGRRRCSPDLEQGGMKLA